MDKGVDEEQGRGIGLARPTFIHIPKTRNQRRPSVGFGDTYMRMPTLVNLRIRVVNKEKEGSGNQTIEVTTNTN